MADTKYTQEHEWIRVEGDVGTIGITQYAQEQLGDVVFVDVPAAGRKVAKGEACAVVESVKAASDIYAPVSGEVVEAFIHDSGIYRYDGQNQSIDFASPSEGVLALEQVLNVTPGSKVKELAFAYIDYLLRPDMQKMLAEGVWYSPSNKKVKLDAKYDAKLLTTEAKVATLIQPDWKWYNARKEDIDARVTKLLKG